MEYALCYLDFKFNMGFILSLIINYFVLLNFNILLHIIHTKISTIQS
jgi:hypothetical protein